MTHICVSKLTTIGSDNGLSPGWPQAIIWTNAGILLIRPLGTSCIEILIEIHTFSFKKMHLKILSGKWQPFCLCLNVFKCIKKILTTKMFLQAKGEAHYSFNWWTARYKSSSRSPPNVLSDKTCMFDVARHVGPSIWFTCWVMATKER